MVQSRKVNGQASAEAGPLAPGQRWSAGRKRDVGAGGGRARLTSEAITEAIRPQSAGRVRRTALTHTFTVCKT